MDDLQLVDSWLSFCYCDHAAVYNLLIGVEVCRFVLMNSVRMYSHDAFFYCVFSVVRIGPRSVWGKECMPESKMASGGRGTGRFFPVFEEIFRSLHVMDGSIVGCGVFAITRRISCTSSGSALMSGMVPWRSSSVASEVPILAKDVGERFAVNGVLLA